MIVASLLLNVLVLVPVAVSLVTNAAWTTSAYGPRTSARDILLAIYFAILASSLVLLVGIVLAPAEWLSGAVVALLGVQVTYKLLTAFLVKAALRNPVVLANLAIAAVHVVTMTIVAGSLF